MFRNELVNSYCNAHLFSTVFIAIHSSSIKPIQPQGKAKSDFYLNSSSSSGERATSFDVGNDSLMSQESKNVEQFCLSQFKVQVLIY